MSDELKKTEIDNQSQLHIEKSPSVTETYASWATAESLRSSENDESFVSACEPLSTTELRIAIDALEDNEDTDQDVSQTESLEIKDETLDIEPSTEENGELKQEDSERTSSSNQEIFLDISDLGDQDEDSNLEANAGCTLRPKKKSKTRVNYKFLKFLQFFMLIVLVLDVILISLQLTENGHKEALQYSGLVVSSVFMVDLAINLYAYGVKMLKSFLEVLDTVIIVASFIITIVFHFYEVDSSMHYLKFLIIGRPLRYVRLLKLCKYGSAFQEVSRKIVSRNRKRWEDEDYNLDLTYITDQIIVMSFPSEGCNTIFRNSCKEVAHFLNEKHTGRHYTIFNLCSENTYDTSCFDGQVIWCPIDDHNVPCLSQMIQYVQLIQTFLDKHEDNKAVIHCKGGKGRTGTIVSSVLIQRGNHTAEESMQYFASKRTSFKSCCSFMEQQRIRVQSQIRYVYYFEKITKEYDGKMPPRKEFQLHSIEITFITAISAQRGADLTFQIHQFHPEQELTFDLKNQDKCSVVLNEDATSIKIIFPGLLRLRDDVKITCFRSSISPCRKKSCIIYFWFHTAFIEGSMLEFSREDLDTRGRKPFRRKGKDFKIQLNLSQDR